MRCSNCGSELESGVTFCKNCGTKVNNENQQYTNVNSNTNNSNFVTDVDDELVSAYIGQSVSDFKNARFSIFAFIFLNFYLFYRKMWLVGIICYLMTWLFNMFMPRMLSIVFVLVFYFVIAYRFKDMYLQHAKSKIQKIINENPNMTRNEIISLCRKKGGKSVIALVIFIILQLFVTIMIIIIPTFQIRNILNKAKKSSAEDLAFSLKYSGYNYVDNFKEKNDGNFPNFDLEFECDGKSCSLITNLKGYDLTDLTELNYTYSVPTSGKVIIESFGNNVTIYNIVINGYTCNTDDVGFVECSKSSKKEDNNKNDNKNDDSSIIEKDNNNSSKVEKEDNNDLEPRIKKLSFSIIDGFVDNSYNANKFYTLTEFNDSCSASFSYSITQDASKYIESEVQSDSVIATEVTPITDITINGVKWLSAKMISESSISYYYATEYGRNAYLVKFKIYRDSGTCTNAHSTLVNSLNFD